MNKIQHIVLTLCSTILGAVLSAWHGGAFIKDSPKALKSALWALPFAIVVFMAFNGWIAYLCAVIAFALCMAGKASGHGGWMDLGTWKQARTDERLEPLILWFYDDMHEKDYDFIGLMLVGFAAVSGAVFTLAFINVHASLVIALGGILKAVGYKIGWEVFPDNENGKATRTGEYFAGAFAYAGLAVGALLCI